MGLKYKLGQAVKQVVPAPVEGVVGDAAIVDGEVVFRVDSKDADGNMTSRFFNEDQIEAAADEE